MGHAVKTVFLIVTMFVAPIGLRSGDILHPQDGPDVDLRVRIDQDQVEIQSIINLAFCDEVVGSNRMFEEVLDETEVEGLEEALHKKFDEHVTLKIDGLQVSPHSRVAELLPYDEDDAQTFPIMGLKAVIKLRLVRTYSLKQPPKSVALHWGLYPRNLAIADLVEVPIDVSAEWKAGATSEIVPFSAEEPEFIWHAPDGGLAPKFLKTPETKAVQENITRFQLILAAFILGVVVLFGALRLTGKKISLFYPIAGIAVICGALFLWKNQAKGTQEAPEIDKKEAVEIFNVLHANVYRAFDFTKEEEIYDALARSVEGELLAEIYNQIYTSLIMQDEGGAVSRIKKVTPIQVDLQDEPVKGAFSVKARWQVLGQVYHWGHTHMRTNEHVAEMSVQWNGSAWHIRESNVIEQSRVSSSTSEGN